MQNILVLYEHSGDNIPHGSSALRLLRPLSHPQLAKSIDMTAGISYEGTNADIIIVDRLWKPNISLDIAEKLVDYVRKAGIKLIYSLDDNLLDLRINEPGNSHPNGQERNIIRYFIREADHVVVSTQNLYERLKHMSKKISIIENSLDERLIKKERKCLSAKKRDKIIIGYMGTLTHDMDFNEILPAIKTISYKYKSIIDFQFVGALSNDRFIGAMPNVTKLDVMGNHEYTKFWGWMNENIYWDIGIAPLKINEFNKSKSDIKFLDYAALEIPGIFTRCPSYENTVIDNKTGLLVENDTKSWVEAFEKLINDGSLRCTIGRNAKEYLLSSRTLEGCVNKWEHILSSVD
jgi:glycosyltransferase involved in cell wall biosynthesis